MSELKPCPFCGSARPFVPDTPSGLAWVECSTCGTAGPRRSHASEAIDLWNTRTADAVREAAERISDALHRWATGATPEECMAARDDVLATHKELDRALRAALAQDGRG